MAFENLFKPIKIGPVQIKNRVALAPMGTVTTYPRGYVNEQVCAYFAARARGGMGLIITGTVLTNKLAYDTHPRNLISLFEDDQMDGMIRLVDVVHAFDVNRWNPLKNC